MQEKEAEQMTRVSLPASLTETGVVAVLRAHHASACLPVARALADAGVTSIELTLTSPGTIDELAHLIESVPNAQFGVGTVLTRSDAIASIRAGARFLVSPAVKSEVIDTALEHGLPVLPGALTPTEVQQAWALGASAVKIFPAGTVGPDYIRHLAGPYPDVNFVPSGGLRLSDIGEWIDAGSSAVSLGGPLLGDAFAGGDLSGLADRARVALSGVQKARR